ncbi:MAG: N-acetylglucosamine-6-phosphate deacetylase [Clostridia bacterium]|nr:N-acetylglucosamine-6-phosphate deacetylase [Clostridia bacterium]
MKRIKSDKIILKDKIFSGYVYFDGDKIVDVTDSELSCDTEYDFTGKYVSSGFIDIHTHGGGGFSFDGTADDVVAAADFHLSHGTTTIFPTVSAAPMNIMENATRSIKDGILSKKSKANIMGAHLEGPYLSAKQCGAQCPDFIKNPDKSEYLPFIEKYGDYVARWSYAPENDIGGEFCKYITSKGIVASAGHTDAIYDDMKLAKENGCNLVTHLFSCTSTITRDHGFRRLGVIETAFLDDDMFVEIIADGKHLPPDLIRLILKIKGTDKVALITDSLSLAGTTATEGIMGATEYIIEDGVCKLKDRSAFAGSIATADRLVRVMVNDVGVNLVDAVKMITAVPAKIMNLNKGELSKGKDADIVVFDDDINIENVFVMGNKVI